MKKSICLSLIMVSCLSFGQVKQTSQNLWQAKGHSKELTLFKSKQYLFDKVFGNTAEPTQFELIPLAAAGSGELTTLLYRCESKNKEGLLLAFYGDYWNDAGVNYQGYGFKNLDKDQSIALLNKIEISIEANKKFLHDNNDNNNISFRFDDMDILIWTTVSSYEIRIFWNNFDSTWEQTAYERSKRRFERKVK